MLNFTAIVALICAVTSGWLIVGAQGSQIGIDGLRRINPDFRPTPIYYAVALSGPLNLVAAWLVFRK